VGPRYEVILTTAAGYGRNVSVRRLIFNFALHGKLLAWRRWNPSPTSS
jgi:hypothetical protein